VPTYVLVDGENVDWAIGELLGRKPQPEERPRWERVRTFAEATFGGPLKCLFFLAAPEGEFSMPFTQALLAMDFRPIPLRGEGKVVDVAISRTLDALAGRPGAILLLSHDGDFAPALANVLDSDPTRQVGLLCFPERAATSLRSLTERGLKLFDLELQANAFQPHVHFPRLRAVQIDEFNPSDFLADE
jgi:uncharacterized protein